MCTMMTVTVVVLAASVSLCVGVGVKGRGRCQQPSQEELGQRWRQERALHESFFQLPFFTSRDLKLEDIEDCVPGYSKGIQQTPLGMEDRACPYTHQADSISAHQGRAGKVTLCPSYSIINFDERRVPSILQEVQCSCSNCAIPTDTTASGQSAKSLFECRPIKYYTRVLRRGEECEGGQYKYHTVWEPLTLACACMKNARALPEENVDVLGAKDPKPTSRIFSRNPDRKRRSARSACHWWIKS